VCDVSVGNWCEKGYLDLETSGGRSLLLQLACVFGKQVNDELVRAALHAFDEIEEECVLVLVAESVCFVVHLIL
jgi:hypothetical protein